VLVLAGSLALVASPAAATESPSESTVELSANELQQLRSFLHENGVSGPTQKALLTKLQRGEPWDSLRPDASPVSEETTLHDRHATTRAVYADGSIVITSVSKPTPESSGEGDVSPLSVEACSVRNSPPYAVYYDSCRADVNYGIIRMGFYFNYQQITSLGAKITSYWGRFQHCFGCTLSDHRLERWSDTQVRYSAECNIAFKGFPAGWTAWMQANVSMTNAWTTNN